MGDLVLVLILLAFFGLCTLYIRGCELMIRNDEIGEPTLELSREAAYRP